MELVLTEEQAKALSSLLETTCVSLEQQVGILNEAAVDEPDPEKLKNIQTYVSDAILQHSIAVTIQQSIENKLAEKDKPKLIIPGR